MTSVTLKANKRSFTIIAPKGREAVDVAANDPRVTRNADRRTTRSGQWRIAHGSGTVFPFVLEAPRRSFAIVAPKVETE